MVTVEVAKGVDNGGGWRENRIANRWGDDMAVNWPVRYHEVALG